jgi:O-antigen/teichoic acid export membrane protein
LIDASIFSFSYPRLISVANACDSNTFSRLMRRFFVHTAVATLCLAIAIYYLSVPLIQLVDNAIYLEYMNMLKLLLCAYSLFILSMVPQYGLYAIRADMAILRGNLVALFAFLASIIVLGIYRPGLTSVPEAMIIAFAAMLVVKSWYLQRGTRVFFTAAGSLGEQRTP